MVLITKFGNRPALAGFLFLSNKVIKHWEGNISIIVNVLWCGLIECILSVRCIVLPVMIKKILFRLESTFV